MNETPTASKAGDGQTQKTFLPAFVTRACDIAYERHACQTRRDTVTLYIEHVQRVALAMRARGNHHAEAVAWLHDVIEDTGPLDWTFEKFPASVEAAVKVLTKGRCERYEDYIHRVGQNGLARIVKLADIVDNLTDDPTQPQRVKYLLALAALTAPSVGAEGSSSASGVSSENPPASSAELEEIANLTALEMAKPSSERRSDYSIILTALIKVSSLKPKTSKILGEQ